MPEVYTIKSADGYDRVFNSFEIFYAIVDFQDKCRLCLGLLKGNRMVKLKQNAEDSI